MTYPALPHSLQLGHGETVLVVDDDRDVLEITAEVVRAIGYQVVSADGAESGEQAYRNHPGRIDLALLDVVMPGRTGPELARRLREIDPDLPVVYVTGYLPDSCEGLQCNDHTGVLTKPYTLERIAGALGRAVASRGKRANPRRLSS